MNEEIIFVYGTLMRGETNAHYLDNSKKIGNGYIDGYQLLQLDGYPGIIPGEGKVFGELYIVDEKTKEQLDILEGDEYHYSIGMIDCDNKLIEAHFYEFIPLDEVEYYPAYTLNHRWVDISHYVWYACYGSNLLDDRFNIYISRTSSKQTPLDSKSIILPYDLYFAKVSHKWNNQGVAFVDTDVQGESYGWMYLITKEQYEEVKEMEGSWYNRLVKVRTDKLGIDILTFTAPYRFDEVSPSQDYIEVIGAGLKEKYHMKNEDIDEYLGVKGYDYSYQHIQNILKDK